VENADRNTRKNEINRQIALLIQRGWIIFNARLTGALFSTPLSALTKLFLEFMPLCGVNKTKNNF